MLREKPTFRRGRVAERIIAGMLRQRGWFVVQSSNYSGEDGDQVPKMHGPLSSLTLPDLDVSRAGERHWVEVKLRWQASLRRMTARYEHGVPLRLIRHYRRVEAESGSPVWIFVLEERSGIVLCARLADLETHGREFHGRGADRGGTVFYPRERFRPFDRISWSQRHALRVAAGAGHLLLGEGSQLMLDVRATPTR